MEVPNSLLKEIKMLYFGSPVVLLFTLEFSGRGSIIPSFFRFEVVRKRGLKSEFHFDLPCRTKFLREFNYFGNGRFFVCVFCGNYCLRLGETGFSCWELLFAIFRNSPSIWNYSILDFRVQTMEYR